MKLPSKLYSVISRGGMLVAGILAYLAGAWITQAIGLITFGPTFVLPSVHFWIVGVGLAVTIARYVFLHLNKDSLFWQLLWALLFLAVVVRLVARVNFFGYGDMDFMQKVIVSGMPISRWLGGSAILCWIYAAVWKFPGLDRMMPPILTTPDALVRLVGALAMTVSAIFMVRRWPARLCVLFPILTPVWIMFSSGYDEYYPFIAGLYTAVLVWLLHERFETQSPYLIGFLAALLVVFYVGFAPISLLVLIVYLAKRPSKTLHSLLSAAFSFVGMVVAFWPQGIVSFFKNLYMSLNLGDSHTMFFRYRGEAASDVSTLFGISYALAPEHLQDLAYMYFWGGGWIIPVVFAVGLILVLVVYRDTWRRSMQDSRFWLGGLVLLWSIYYLLFMIPKWGPQQDVDLFFSTYIIVALVAGLSVDLILKKLPQRANILYPVLSAILGNAVVANSFLLWIGIPRRM